MQTQKMAIPAQCKRCGELFDMSYDMKKTFEEEIEHELESPISKTTKRFCWECRFNV